MKPSDVVRPAIMVVLGGFFVYVVRSLCKETPKVHKYRFAAPRSVNAPHQVVSTYIPIIYTSRPMALESGKYFIFSMLHGAPVGRNLIEDSSLLPKAIYKLPDGSEPSVVSTRSLLSPIAPGHLRSPVLLPLPRAVLLQWDVEKLPNGNYKLLNRRAAVGALEGRLLAFLIDGEALLDSLEWSIQRADGRDPDGDTYVYVPGLSVPLSLGYGTRG